MCRYFSGWIALKYQKVRSWNSKSNMTLMSSKAGAGNVFVKAEIEKIRST